MNEPTNNAVDKHSSSMADTTDKPDLTLSKKSLSGTNNRPFDTLGSPDKDSDKASLLSSLSISPPSPLTQQSPLPVAQPNHHNTAITSTMEKQLLRYNHLTYLLYMVSFFTAGLTWVVPIVMNYVRRHDAQNSWLASHFDWQIKTFWYSIIAGMVGVGLMLFGAGGSLASLFSASSQLAFGSLAVIFLGGFVIFIAYLWHFYRIVKGWIALTDKRPVS